LDAPIAALRQRFEGTVDTQAAFVPEALRERGRKGGAVAVMV
jgi:hypothetical protein